MFDHDIEMFINLCVPFDLDKSTNASLWPWPLILTLTIPQLFHLTFDTDLKCFLWPFLTSDLAKSTNVPFDLESLLMKHLSFLDFWPCPCQVHNCSLPLWQVHYCFLWPWSLILSLTCPNILIDLDLDKSTNSSLDLDNLQSTTSIDLALPFTNPQMYPLTLTSSLMLNYFDALSPTKGYDPIQALIGACVKTSHLHYRNYGLGTYFCLLPWAKQIYKRRQSCRYIHEPENQNCSIAIVYHYQYFAFQHHFRRLYQ